MIIIVRNTTAAMLKRSSPWLLWLTVLLSCHKPGRIAGAVSPVESLRYTEISRIIVNQSGFPDSLYVVDRSQKFLLQFLVFASESILKKILVTDQIVGCVRRRGSGL